MEKPYRSIYSRWCFLWVAACKEWNFFFFGFSFFTHTFNFLFLNSLNYLQLSLTLWNLFSLWSSLRMQCCCHLDAQPSPTNKTKKKNTQNQTHASTSKRQKKQDVAFRNCPLLLTQVHSGFFICLRRHCVKSIFWLRAIIWRRPPRNNHNVFTQKEENKIINHCFSFTYRTVKFYSPYSVNRVSDLPHLGEAGDTLDPSPPLPLLSF